MKEALTETVDAQRLWSVGDLVRYQAVLHQGRGRFVFPCKELDHEFVWYPISWVIWRAGSHDHCSHTFRSMASASARATIEDDDISNVQVVQETGIGLDHLGREQDTVVGPLHISAGQGARASLLCARVW